jgi:hypothetical protein
LSKLYPEVKIPKKTGCVACITGKLSKHHHPQGVARPKFKPGEKIHCDRAGPHAKDLYGRRWTDVFVDEATRFVHVVHTFSKAESAAHIPEVIRLLEKATGNKLKVFKTDADPTYGAGEKGSRALKSFYADNGIDHQYPGADDHEFNSLVEVTIRHIRGAAATLIEFSNAPPRFGSVIVDTVVFYHNELPLVKGSGGEPISRRCQFEGHNVLWDFNNARAVGSLAIVWIPPNNREAGKTWSQKKAWKGILLGYDSHSLKAYRVWDPKRGKIRGVPYEFNTSLEHVFPWKDKKNWSQEDLDCPSAYIPEPDHLLVAEEWGLFDFDTTENAQAVNNVLPNMTVESLLPLESPMLSEAQADPDEDVPEQKIAAPVDSSVSAYSGQDKTVWQQDNPKRVGSASHDRYERYKGANTVAEALELGASRNDITWDLARGFVVVGEADASVASAFLAKQLN